jgi:hypothetical protein
VVESSTAEQAVAEQAAGEQAAGEQAAGEQAVAEPAGAEQAGAEPAGGVQAAAEPAGAEQAAVEPAGAEQAAAEPAGVEPAGGEPAGGELAGDEQAAAEQAVAEQAAAAPAGVELAWGELAGGELAGGELAVGAPTAGEQARTAVSLAPSWLAGGEGSRAAEPAGREPAAAEQACYAEPLASSRVAGGERARAGAVMAAGGAGGGGGLKRKGPVLPREDDSIEGMRAQIEALVIENRGQQANADHAARVVDLFARLKETEGPAWQKLLQVCGDPNTEREEVGAAYTSARGLLDLQWEQLDDDGHGVLYAACATGNARVCELLLSEMYASTTGCISEVMGFEVWRCLVHRAARHGNVETYEWLLTDKRLVGYVLPELDWFDALCFACAGGLQDVVRRLKRWHTADKWRATLARETARGWQPLHWATAGRVAVALASCDTCAPKAWAGDLCDWGMRQDREKLVDLLLRDGAPLGARAGLLLCSRSGWIEEDGGAVRFDESLRGKPTLSRDEDFALTPLELAYAHSTPEVVQLVRRRMDFDRVSVRQPMAILAQEYALRWMCYSFSEPEVFDRMVADGMLDAPALQPQFFCHLALRNVPEGGPTYVSLARRLHCAGGGGPSHCMVGGGRLGVEVLAPQKDFFVASSGQPSEDCTPEDGTPTRMQRKPVDAGSVEAWWHELGMPPTAVATPVTDSLAPRTRCPAPDGDAVRRDRFELPPPGSPGDLRAGLQPGVHIKNRSGLVGQLVEKVALVRGLQSLDSMWLVQWNGLNGTREEDLSRVQFELTEPPESPAAPGLAGPSATYGSPELCLRSSWAGETQGLVDITPVRGRVWGLTATSEEFQGVKASFEEAMSRYTVDSVFRVQNTDLSHRFETERCILERKHGAKGVNERTGWHATVGVEPSVVCNKGFDITYAQAIDRPSEGESAYGLGIYFAEHPLYSHVVASHESNRGFSMIRARVLLGKCKDFGETLAKKLKRCPEGYDSWSGTEGALRNVFDLAKWRDDPVGLKDVRMLVDNGAEMGRQYVVGNVSAIYPEYVIKYSTREA